MRKPDLIAHADWGSNPARRWVAIATLEAERYHIEAPIPAGDPGSLIARLRARVGTEACILIGFDFPIGLPYTYAQRMKVHFFPDFLLQIDQEPWTHFSLPAASPQEISFYRPFYPARPGSARAAHLLRALEVGSLDDLRRSCELAHPGRRAAAPLFWTIGAQQAGKAALNGWQHVLIPQIRQNPLTTRLWPFDGRVEDLLQPGNTVIAEVYPAEFYARLGFRFSKGGKGSRQARAEQFPAWQRWACSSTIRVDDDLLSQLYTGFEPALTGADRFDALTGLAGLVKICLDCWPVSEPEGNRLRAIEGWILGQKYPSNHTPML